jgi:hypothetical protein
VLSRAAHLVLSRIELELRNHGGHNSARLAVTFDDFVEYGIHRHGVAAALRELEALGIVLITERGRGGNAEYRQPHRFCLNYQCGAVDAQDEVTNAWRKIETPEQAEQIARDARDAKDPNKVAYGHRSAPRQKAFPSPQKRQDPAPKSGAENALFPAPQSGATGPAPKTGATFDISGGGGG